MRHCWVVPLLLNHSGVREMSAKSVTVCNLATAEKLGRVTLLCPHKTSTLTMNIMSAAKVSLPVLL